MAWPQNSTLVRSVTSTKLIASLLVLTSCAHNPQLVVQDQHTDEIYFSQPAKDTQFSLEWIHSIEKTPWKEIYVLTDQEIYLTEVILESYGAGAPTDLPGLTETRDGIVRTHGINQHFDRLTWVHSHNTHHVLTIGERTIDTKIPHQAFVELVVK